jgi:hypothetical protein
MVCRACAFLAVGGVVLAFVPQVPRPGLDPDLALALFLAPVLLPARKAGNGAPRRRATPASRTATTSTPAIHSKISIVWIVLADGHILRPARIAELQAALPRS